MQFLIYIILIYIVYQSAMNPWSVLQFKRKLDQQEMVCGNYRKWDVGMVGNGDVGMVGNMDVGMVGIWKWQEMVMWEL